MLAGLTILTLGLGSSAASAEICPNATFRVGPSAGLPDCRAYEMVSPPEKNGAEPTRNFTVQSAPSGNASAWMSPTPLPGSAASLAGGYNLSRRTSTGWTTSGLDAPQLNETSKIITTVKGLSRDLSKAIVISRRALAPGAVEGNGNVYLQDNETGQRTLVAFSSDNFFFNDMTGNERTVFDAASPDFGRVVFETGFPLAPAGGEEVSESSGQNTNIYEWSLAGGAQVTNKLPGGTEESHLAAEHLTRTLEKHGVSDDGSRVFFQTASGVYMRTNGSSTHLISTSQRTGDDHTVPHKGTFIAASADGSVVYFQSEDQLTDNAGAGGYPGELYRYEVETGKLETITPTSAAIEAVEQVSGDGSYVYFNSSAALAAGAEAGKTHEYVWHNGVTRLVATLGPQEGFGLAESSSMSQNGKWFTFRSMARPTGYDNTSSACAGEPNEGIPAGVCTEVYLYDAEKDQLTCVSCNPNGRPGGYADLGNHTALISWYVGPNVTDSGQVFFDTTDSLVPRDSNGVGDVYKFAAGSISLISSGTSDQESMFKDATPNGSDVFFQTRQRLVGQDVDESADLYDARVGGGFPPPVGLSTCTGTACQGVPPAPPIFATPPSVTFSGVGNFEAPVKTVAKPKKKAKKRHSKHKKVKKAKRSSKSSKRSIHSAAHVGGPR
ncbi:MAG TPA: hypothetical protein VGI50_12250 [Solirubrobacteraceae bacterium]